MKRFVQCFKDNIAICVSAFALAVVQAVCCLVIPVFTGEAVGTGIQKKGYPDSYPVGMSRDAFALFKFVLPEEKRNQLDAIYVYGESIPDYIEPRYATDKSCYWLREDAGAESAESLFLHACACALYEINKTVNIKNLDSYTDVFERVSFGSLLVYAERLQITESEREKCSEAADRAGELLKQQVAATFLPYIYEDAGMDCRTMQKNYLTASFIKITAAALAQLVCALLCSALFAKLSVKLEMYLRGELRKTFLNFSPDSAKRSPEDVREIYHNCVARAGISINFAAQLLIYSVSVVAVGFAMTLINQRFISLLIALCTAAICAVIFAVYKVSYAKYYRMNENYMSYSGIMEKHIENVIQIRAEKAQNFAKDSLNSASTAIQKDEGRVMKGIYFALSSIGLFMNVLTAAVIVISGKHFLSAGMSVSDIVAYMQIAVLVVTALTATGAAVMFAPELVVHLKKIFAVLDGEAQCDEEPPLSAIDVDYITFDRVRLFEGSSEISFTARKGELTVISGATGSGKSSLLNALLRRMKPFSGEICINGRNINDLGPSYPSSSVSFVPSEPVIFSDTLYNNMLYYGGEAGSMEKALEISACGFLGETGEALGTFLSDCGEHFSGGQRSRITLACALSKNVPVYLLDDCLSSLDVDTFNRVVDGIKSSFKNAVVIFASNSSEALKKADNIVSIT